MKMDAVAAMDEKGGHISDPDSSYSDPFPFLTVTQNTIMQLKPTQWPNVYMSH